MRGQYVLILTILILLVLYGIYTSTKVEYSIYDSNIVKYIAYNYWYQIANESNATIVYLINKTYESICPKLKIYCEFNGTYVKVISATKEYVLRAK